MKNEFGFGIALALASVFLIGQTCWGSPRNGSTYQETLAAAYGNPSPSAAADLKGAIVLAASEGGSKGEGEKKEGAVNPLMYEWDPVLVNLADAGGKRYLKITMKMEMSDPKMRKELDDRSYVIKDALIMILCDKEYDDICTISGKTRLKQEIITRINKILKTGQIKEIYFTDFIVQ